MHRALGLLTLLACSPTAADPAGGGEAAEHRAGLEVLCAAELRSGGIETFPFAAKMQTIHGWLDAHLEDAWVRRFHEEILPKAPLPEQGELLRRHAAEAGLASCPYAGLIDFLGGLSAEAHAVEDCTKACVERNDGSAESIDDVAGACERGCGG